jgi:hypothetical protein
MRILVYPGDAFLGAVPCLMAAWKWSGEWVNGRVVLEVDARGRGKESALAQFERGAEEHCSSTLARTFEAPRSDEILSRDSSFVEMTRVGLGALMTTHGGAIVLTRWSSAL